VVVVLQRQAAVLVDTVQAQELLEEAHRLNRRLLLALESTTPSQLVQVALPQPAKQLQEILVLILSLALLPRTVEAVALLARTRA
jgi:hypothetical protein